MLMVRETSSSVFFTFLFLGLHLSYQTSMHVRVRQRPIHMTTFNKHAQWLSGRERRWALLCSSRKWREGVSTVEEMLAINLYSTNGQTSFSACTLCSAIYRASEKNSNAVKKGNKNVLFILRRTFSSSTVDFFFHLFVRSSYSVGHEKHIGRSWHSPPSEKSVMQKTINAVCC